MTRSASFDADVLRAVLGRGTFWGDLRVVAETGSTSSDLAILARAGAPEGTVILADHQTAGRGRLGRTWHAPSGTSIAVSMLFRPAPVPVARWPWLPLLAGVAVVEAVRAETGVAADLKWPNDVMVDGLKLAGLLAEVVPQAGRPETAEGGGGVIVGVGLNVTAQRSDLPPTATSLALCGATDLDWVRVLAAVLRSVAHRYAGWCTDAGEPGAVQRAYRPLCATLGAQVRVQLPAGGSLTGQAIDIDDDGRLVVRTAAGDRALSAGDVVHVR